MQQRLAAAGQNGPAFSAFQQDHQRRTAARVREGDLDAMVYYALQSTAFTAAPPIEPALSAKTLVEGLDASARQRFLAGDDAAADRVTPDVRQRLAALVGALRQPPARSRLAEFRDILAREKPADTASFLRGHYVRAMRFLYEKEFVAAAAGGTPAVAALYHERGLSTDTAVEAGFVVQLGLATLQAIEPGRRIRRVLIVGPGLDLAPRTGLLEVGPPESYQPYAVIDALVSLGLSRLDDLVVFGADVNPRVVAHLESARERAVPLTLISGVGNRGPVTLDDDYRRYFDRLGGAIGRPGAAPVLPARYDGHLRKAIIIPLAASAVVRGIGLDIATERVDEGAFDLVVATNVLPYLDDTLLVMALSNITAMLAPGGVFLHNEARPLVAEVGGTIGLPLQHARSAAIASVRGAPPLADAIWIHQKTRQ